ncbi:MAG TPA: type II secretion system protein [Acidimicrobiales bacterium]|nr:type II secretion system protein [Acidimicrobiales bacterium]
MPHWSDVVRAWRNRSHATERSDGAEEGAEAGFTLIELMVVLLIMSILMAIAIPTFLGVKTGAQDRSAQSDLTNATISATAIFVADNGIFNSGPTLISELGLSEPEFTFTSGTVTPDEHATMSIFVSQDQQVIILAEASADQRCWYAEVNEEASANNNGGGDPYATEQQGVSYAGSELSAGALSSCSADGTVDPILQNGPGEGGGFSGWSPTYPS